MKKALIALLVTFLPVGLAYPQRKSDRELNEFIGPVRSVQIKKKISYPESGSSSVEYFKFTFDANGNRTDRPTYTGLDYFAQGGSFDDLENPDKLSEIFGYNHDGSIRYKEVYTFDDKGNRTSKTRYDSTGSLEYKYVYTYDDRGRKTEDTYYTSDDTWVRKAVYAYDDMNNKISETYYKEGGLIIGKTEFNYDDNGRVIEDILYDAKGMLERKMVYAYNSQGQKIEETCYGADGKIESQWVNTYKYDKKGNWIELTSQWTIGGKMVLKERIYRAIKYYQEK